MDPPSYSQENCSWELMANTKKWYDGEVATKIVEVICTDEEECGTQETNR